MNNIQKGRAGEMIALKYLIDNKANILETNYRINSGEIDIKIVNTAKYYILKNNLNNVPIRFDVIEIYLKDKKINHIVNAF